MCHFLAILGSSNWSILPVCNTNMLTFMLLAKNYSLIHINNVGGLLRRAFTFFFFCLSISFSILHFFLHLLYLVFFHFLLRYASDYILLYVSDHVGNGMNSRERLCGRKDYS